VTGAAGTGKTAVLTARFAERVAAGADPERIALVVAGPRARIEAQESLLAALGRSLPALRVTTIHGLAFQLVTERTSTRGDEPPTVLDATAQFARVQQLLEGEREHPERWPRYHALLHLRGFADELRHLVSRLQEAALTPDDVATAAAGRGLDGWSELAAFYARYLDDLARRGEVDFAGLLRRAALLAAEGPPPLDEVLADDYHDATLAAEDLLLSLRAPCTVVAGDPESHVFSFQGASVVPLARFAERADAATVELTTLHRAPGGVNIDAWSAAHSSEEHRAIARELRRIHVEEGVAWSEVAVVVRRQGTDLLGLVRALDDAGVPRATADPGPSPSLAAATRPFVLALRWLVASGEERDEMVETMLTSELGGVTPATGRTLLRSVRAQGRPPAAALDADQDVTPAERASLAALREALAAASERQASVQDAFRELWRRLPYSGRLVEEADRSEQGAADLATVVAFARSTTEAAGSADPGVAAFVAAMRAREGGPGTGAGGGGGGGAPPPPRDAVHVLTAHAAAGMEFDTVVVTGAVEGDFPSLARPEPMFDLDVLRTSRTRSDINRARIADERRLFRMVLGRARRRVLLTASHPYGEEAHGVRSRFAEELRVRWQAVPDAPFESPVSIGEAAATWRRRLADHTASAPQRLAAMAGLQALRVDAATWWHQRDWTPGEPVRDALRLSYSRMDRLENCELQFVLSEELGLDPGGGYQAWVGKLVHGIIEDIEAEKIERTPDAFERAVRDAWQPQRFPSYAISEAELRNAIDVLIPNWFERYGAQPAHPHGTERWFSFDMDGARIRGKIDRIGPAPEGGTRITDFKTGRADNAGKPEDSLQLGLYYLAVQRCEDLQDFRPVDGVELAFLGGTRGKKELRVLDWPIDPAEEAGYVTTVRDRVSELIARVRELDEQGEYVASAQASCFFCRFQPLCPRYAEGGEVFPVRAPATAEAVR
jgi:superfamily I DNA/RNA helicase